jgi:nicotinate-nucleotide adenylyltransferase
MTKRIGIFGGTFNPVHFGHINLALELKEKKDLTEVWFIPSLLSPLRMHETLLEAHHRANMLTLALAEIPGFELCDLELRRPPPSYTIDTVKEILELYPQHTFFLLFGEDSLMRFREWKEPLEIVRLLPLLIGSRPNSGLLKLLPTLGFNEEIASAIRKGLIPTRQMEISATELRERLKKRLYCGHFLSRKVLDYIYENQLYSMSP